MYGILYSHGACSMIGFIDSDRLGNLNQRRSTIRYVFTLGGGANSQQSMIQPTIALFTVEVECMAAVIGAKEAIY